MKTLKLLSLALAFLLLCGCLPLFAACAPEKEGDISLSRKKIDVDLTGYSLVYGTSQSSADYTSLFHTHVNKIASGISGATGERVTAYSMARTKTGPEDKEILVGVTGREESTKALNEIKGEGFIIKVTENKVVLVGTSNLFTWMAMDQFIKLYLEQPPESAVFSLHKSVELENAETVTLATNEEANYTYVYKDGMGTYPPGFAGTNHATLAHSTYKEYSQVAIDEIVAKMVSVTGLRNRSFPIETDKKAYEREVLVGPVSNPESRALLESVAENECVIGVVGEDVIVNAWNENVLSVAIGRYHELLLEATTKGADGSVCIQIPKGFRFTEATNPEWIRDFPRPEAEGLSLYNTMDAGEGALQFLYMGEGATAEAHKAYCDKLKDAGYSVYMDTATEGSIFTTLVNKKENIMLYVAYNAYAHEAEYDTEYNWTASKVNTKDFGWYEYDPAIRIVSVPLDKAFLPEEKILKPQNYSKVTDFSISTMPLYGIAVGMIYVLTLEDGSFIVFDGGNVNANGAEHDMLWNVMAMKYAEFNGGAAPTKEKPIRIAAWIMSHPHQDHMVAFEQMLRKYGSSGKLKMEYMIANTPGPNSAYPVRGEGNALPLSRIKSLQALVAGGFQFIEARTGYVFHLANVKIEVLACWEDLNPWVINDGNETCVVLRFEVSNQDAPNAKPITQIWTGDAQRWQSRYMCAVYGDYLKADMVSIAHHGNIGCEIDFYETVQPTTIWWPNNAASAASYLNPDWVSAGWQREVDMYFANELDSVHYIFMSGIQTEGDKHYTTLKFTVNGPDYENIYDLKTGEKLSYTDISAGAHKGISDCMRK